MPAKINLPVEQIAEMCNLFSNGSSIPELMSRYDLSRNKITRTLREGLGDEYRSCALRILASSGAKSAHKRRGKKQNRTPEWNAKIGAALRGKQFSVERIEQIRKTWKLIRDNKTPEEIKTQYKKAVTTKRNNGYFEVHSKRHSEWMKQNAPNRGKPTPETTRQKQREAKARFFANGGKPARLGQLVSESECMKRSASTKRMWSEGKFSYGEGSVMRSKVEKQFYERILTAHPDALHSHWLTHEGTTYVFDVFIPSLRTFIEVNGNYWHFNPQLYEATYHDPYRNVTAQEIWDKDAQKCAAAKAFRHNVITVWEDEAPTFDVTSLQHLLRA